MDDPGLGKWLWGERGNVLALLGLLVTVAAAYLSWLFFHLPSLRQELKDNDTYRERKAEQLLYPRWVAVYRGWLVAALDRLDRWMGRPEERGKGFEWCFSVGLAYSFGFLLLAWLLGVPARLGDLVLLADPMEVPWGWRMILAPLLAGSAALAYAGFRYEERFRALIDDRVANTFPSTLGDERRKQCSRWSRRGATYLAVFALLHFGAGLDIWVAGAMGVAVAFAVALAVAGAVGGAVGGAIAAFVLAIGLVFTANFGFGLAAEIIIPTIYFLFLLALPLLNAIFDWLSWLASRRLGRDLAARLDPDCPSGWRRVGAFAWHMAVDLALAVLTLVGLAWSIPRAIGLFNALLRWLGFPAPLALGDYLCRSALDPWGQGLWASLMLFSTLVPTAVHLAFLLAAPFAWLASRGEVWQARARHLLGEAPPPAADLPRRATLQPAADATALHPETLRQVVLHFAVVRPCLLLAALALACLMLWAIFWLFTVPWDPLPRLLLRVATGDPAATASCFAGVGR